MSEKILVWKKCINCSICTINYPDNFYFNIKDEKIKYKDWEKTLNIDDFSFCPVEAIKKVKLHFINKKTPGMELKNISEDSLNKILSEIDYKILNTKWEEKNILEGVKKESQMLLNYNV